MDNFRTNIPFLHHKHIHHSQRGKIKMNDFHKPFIKNLVFIAACTIVSMILAPIFVNSWISLAQKNKQFTTVKSYSSTESQVKEPVSSVSE
jgi:hypothetical protein